MATGSLRGWLALVLVVTASARLGFIVFFGSTLSLATSGYDAYATSLLAGIGYAAVPAAGLDSALPPLYAFLLAGLYGLFGRSPHVVALAQTALDLVTTGVLFSIGRRIGDVRVGLLAALLYGLYPYLLFQNLTLNDTGLFILILVTSVRLAYAVADGTGWAPAATLGTLLGAGTLTKSFACLLLPLFAACWRRQGARNALPRAVIALVALLLVVGPWAVRNTRLHGALALVSSNLGSNLHQGNNPCVVAHLARGWDAQWVDCLGHAPAGLGELAADRWHRSEALGYLRGHPEAWPRLFGTKLLVLWSPTITPSALPPGVAPAGDPVHLYHTARFQVARGVHLAYFGPLLALGLVGLILAWRARRSVCPLVAVPILITAVYVGFHPSTRYRAPADPFVFVLSAYAVVRAWDGRARGRAGAVAP